MGVGRSRFAWIAVLAVAVLVVGVGAGYSLSRSPTTDPRGAGQVAAGSSAPGPQAPARGGATAATSGPSAAHLASSVPASAAGSSSGASAPGTASAATTAASSLAAGAAPTSAAGFDPRHTLVPITFPLPATPAHHLIALWRVARLGVVYPYNQIRGVAADGTLLRAHDGVDIAVAIGTPVLAPFSGVIVNPAALWRPWDPQRYGNVVVVRSSEATSRGYYAILVHLSSKSVTVGQKVSRGQVVGKTGSTGNADGTTPHLHFELRAPFPIAFHYGGVLRMLDDFDPLPSLRAAEPGLH